MRTMRLIFAAFGIVLAVLIVWAIQTGNFSAAGSWLLSDPWGIVTLFDLYTGLAISALFIVLFERNWKSLLWVVPLPFLGNVWTAVWIVLRLPEIARRLAR